MSEPGSILTARDGKVFIVTINRPQVRNAVDSSTARALANAFQDFAADDALHVAILTGAANTFCAGADLREVADGRRTAIEENGTGRWGQPGRKCPRRCLRPGKA